MKIALIIAAELEMSPYLRTYMEAFGKIGIDYDIIEWRRDFSKRRGCDSIISFEYSAPIARKVYKKIFDYFRFARFTKSVIQKNKYDKLVVVGYQTTLFLRRFLLNNYSGHYILDIRDYSKIFKFIKCFVKKVDRKAYARVISSIGYKEWLTKTDKDVICHNVTIDRLNKAKDILSPPFKYPLTILTNGALRTYYIDKRIVDAFDGFNVFFRFSGKGKDSILYKQLADSSPNVEYTGYYNRDDEVKLATQSSFINVFLEDCTLYNTAMSNRFYLSLITGIPMIVNSQNVQSSYVSRYYLGVVADTPESIPRKMKEYIDGFDISRYNEGRREVISMIMKDMRLFQSLIMDFTSKSKLPYFV